MDSLVCQIKECIEKKLLEGGRNFAIFPYGDVGMQVKHILNNAYGIQEIYIFDNRLCHYNSRIKPLSSLENIECGNLCLILASTDLRIYDDLKREIRKYFAEENIAELQCISYWKEENKKREQIKKREECITQIGRYSYGPLCRNHLMIESIGAFCSFAIGCEVVSNHEIYYITTHPLIYGAVPWGRNYTEYEQEDWYFEGVNPQADKLKMIERIKIGNDVWLGRNVIITNYANIGNGVIAGAGAVITKDVPDYAVVVGVPARIIRYRFSPKEIEALNKIAWWDWADEEIRERYNDFYLLVQEFINKYA